MIGTTMHGNFSEGTPMPVQAPLQIPGALIARLRKERGLTAQQLGEMVGTSQQTIDKIEKGLIKYSKFFSGIKEALGITPEMLQHGYDVADDRFSTKSKLLGD